MVERRRVSSGVAFMAVELTAGGQKAAAISVSAADIGHGSYVPQ
ncbi:MAG: hypothetical protein ACK4SY_07745 [Pyrobaculum sp.]